MTNSAVEVSVVICVLNAEGTLRAQLEALGGQQDSPVFEVLIVDNGSHDGSVEVAQAWIDDGIGAATSARIIDASGRRGICHARNAGALAAHGEALAFCDADDVVASTWLAGVSVGIGSGHDMVTGRVLSLNRSGLPSGEILIDSPDGIQTVTLPRRTIPFARGCNFAITKGAFAQVGGFDEALPPYGCDDLDFGIRFERHGLDLAYVPEMAVCYRQTAGARRRARRQFRSGVAQACLWDRHPDVYGPLPTVRLQVFGLPLTTCRSLVQAPGSLKDRTLAALLTLSKSLGAIHGLRHWVQGGRLREPALLATHNDTAHPPDSHLRHR